MVEVAGKPIGIAPGVMTCGVLGATPGLPCTVTGAIAGADATEAGFAPATGLVIGISCGRASPRSLSAFLAAFTTRLPMDGCGIGAIIALGHVGSSCG